MSTKRKIANKLISNKEKEAKVPVFQSAGWEARKKAIADRVKRKQDLAHAKAVTRKENASAKAPTKKELKNAKALIAKVEAKKKKRAWFLSRKK